MNTSINQGHEFKKYKLTVLTPTFIGVGFCINKSQYIYRKGTDKVLMVDEGKFANYLFGRNLFDRYCRFLQDSARKREDHGLSLIGWLSDNDIMPKDYAHFTKYTIDFEKEYITDTFHDIHCFIKTPDNKPYIPGSSIKGAIRTAIMFSRIKNDKSFIPIYIREDIGRALHLGETKKLEGMCEEIEEKFFKDGDSRVKNFMHGISVSDSSEMSDKNLCLIEKLDLSTLKSRNGKSEKNIPLYRECIKPLTETTFTLSVDSSITKHMGIHGTHDIFKCLDEYNNFMLNEIYPLFSKLNTKFMPSANKNLAPCICLGGGAGMFSKVVTYALFPDVKTASQIIKMYLDKKFKPHKHALHDNIVSPRALKLGRFEEDSLLVGWCNLKEI